MEADFGTLTFEHHNPLYMAVHIKIVFIKVVYYQIIYNLFNWCFAQKSKYQPPQSKQNRPTWKQGYN